jgi:hypothetical protein
MQQLLKLTHSVARNMVSDPINFNADPDPAFHFNADPDPAFHFNADPDPAFHFNADQDPHQALHASFLSVHGSFLSFKSS